MNSNELLVEVDFDDFLIDGEDLILEFRDRYGEYRMGRIEADPEMGDYEETIDLALSLRGC